MFLTLCHTCLYQFWICKLVEKLGYFLLIREKPFPFFFLGLVYLFEVIPLYFCPHFPLSMLQFDHDWMYFLPDENSNLQPRKCSWNAKCKKNLVKSMFVLSLLSKNLLMVQNLWCIILLKLKVFDGDVIFINSFVQ